MNVILIFWQKAWAIAAAQSIVLLVLALIVFGGAVYVGYWLLSRLFR